MSTTLRAASSIPHQNAQASSSQLHYPSPDQWPGPFADLLALCFIAALDAPSSNGMSVSPPPTPPNDAASGSLVSFRMATIMYGRRAIPLLCLVRTHMVKQLLGKSEAKLLRLGAEEKEKRDTLRRKVVMRETMKHASDSAENHWPAKKRKRT